MYQSALRRKAPVARFSARRLNDISGKGWAVIAEPAGSIALSDDKLLMRFSQQEAEELAGRMTEALQGEPATLAARALAARG